MQCKIAIDIDGVITANPSALSWLTYHLTKNENDFIVYILSWRDGSNEQRVEETKRDLQSMGIRYNELIMAPQKFNIRTACYWKIKTIKELGIQVWMDDELKIYKRDLNIKLDKLLPNVVMIAI